MQEYQAESPIAGSWPSLCAVSDGPNTSGEPQRSLRQCYLHVPVFYSVLKTHAQFLGVRRQLVGDPATGVVILALVGHEIGQPHATVLADQPERDLPFLQQTDQVGPGDVEQVGGLLSSFPRGHITEPQQTQ